MRDKAFNIATILIYDGCQRGLASIVYKVFDKKTSVGAIKNEDMSNKELAEEFHKPIIRKFEKRKLLICNYMQLNLMKDLNFFMCY